MNKVYEIYLVINVIGQVQDGKESMDRTWYLFMGVPWSFSFKEMSASNGQLFNVSNVYSSGNFIAFDDSTQTLSISGDISTLLDQGAHPGTFITSFSIIDEAGSHSNHTFKYVIQASDTSFGWYSLLTRPEPEDPKKFMEQKLETAYAEETDEFAYIYEIDTESLEIEKDGLEKKLSDLPYDMEVVSGVHEWYADLLKFQLISDQLQSLNEIG